MIHVFRNAVASVAKPPVLLVLIAQAEKSWCQQLSEEGYTVVQVPYPDSENGDLVRNLAEAQAELQRECDWALVTYGLKPEDISSLTPLLSSATPRACVHYCPTIEDGHGLLHEAVDGAVIPTLFHLSSKQEVLHASLLELAETKSTDIPTSRFPPIAVHAYPLVPVFPPFPFLAGPPIDHASGKVGTIDPHLRSANNLAYTRTLELLRRELGPHFPLEKLWEKHTYYEFVERDSQKTMSTMVSTPYVNHVPTMTGGVGYKDLARFYKYHFTKEDVTPPDTELITISRTVGADRIIDEMIFKCTHTTEIDYFLPGIKPTGKPLEIALVGVVAFRGDKLTFEHIYWDQASALVQLGLIDSTVLPVAGTEVAHKVVDPFGLPSNTLLARWKESEGLPID
ncbi:NTF2-like protein [Cubamyces menziesii]|nr:NTF2-like protein [Cubamyces menziesii]